MCYFTINSTTLLVLSEYHIELSSMKSIQNTLCVVLFALHEELLHHTRIINVVTCMQEEKNEYSVSVMNCSKNYIDSTTQIQFISGLLGKFGSGCNFPHTNILCEPLKSKSLASVAFISH